MFNAAPYLPEALGSVVAQTHESWELLVVDDGSSDESLTIATTFAQERPDRRIRVMTHPHNGNRGVSVTRNLALSAAAGELVAFLDADDAWLPAKLERQVAALATVPDTNLVYGRAHCIDERSQRVRWEIAGGSEIGSGCPMPFDGYASFLHADIFIPTLTVLARTAAVRALGGFPVGLRAQVEDFVLWARLLRRGRALFVDEPLAMYRVHRASYTGQQSSLRQCHARLEGLLRIADDEADVDRDVALAILRQARAFLGVEGSSRSARLIACVRALEALHQRGGLQPSLLSAAVWRRWSRARAGRGASA